jgi:hypothetical protein
MRKHLLILGIGLLAPALAFADELPIPPIPPANPPLAELAPVPNREVLAPRGSEEELRLRPAVFQATRPDSSLAFSPGSRYQAADERRPLQTPGLLLTVPLR